MKNNIFDLELLRRRLGYKSQSDFIKDFVNLRHYQRTLVDGNKTNLRIDDFIKILKDTTLSLRESFDILFDIYSDEKKTVIRLYNAVLVGDDLLVGQLKKDILEKDILVKNNLLLFKYSLLIYKHKKTIINDFYYLDLLINLVDYPNILEKDIYSLVELMILSEILYFIDGINQEKIFKKIEQSILTSGILTDVNSRNSHYFALIYKIANYLGDKGKYLESIIFLEKGINESLRLQDFYLLEYFYFNLALGFFNLEIEQKWKDALIKCYLILLLKNNNDEMNKFIRWFKLKFNINDIRELVISFFS